MRFRSSRKRSSASPMFTLAPVRANSSFAEYELVRISGHHPIAENSFAKSHLVEFDRAPDLADHSGEDAQFDLCESAGRNLHRIARDLLTRRGFLEMHRNSTLISIRVGVV